LENDRMESDDWIVVGEGTPGLRGEWLLPPAPSNEIQPPVLFVRDPLAEPTYARAVAVALAHHGRRVLWVDTDSMSPAEAAADRAADGTDESWVGEEVYADRPAVRELGLLVKEMGPGRPAVVGVGMGATWALLLGCQSLGVSAVGWIQGRLVYPRLSANKPVQPLEMILNLDVPVLLVVGQEDGVSSGEQVELARDRFAAFGIEVEVERLPPGSDADAQSASRVAARLHLFLSSAPRESR
jgi:pimeloyl-ACP methyl ester carboxylesterase